MTAVEYQALAVHARSIVLRDAWLEFLADCIANASRPHSPEEVAAASEYLARDPRCRQPELNLRGSDGR